MKFQIGDTVQVVKDLMADGVPLFKQFKVGHRGKVISRDNGPRFHYEVRRSNGNTQYFNARELKLIKKK